MTVTLRSREDLTVEALRAVAWVGAGVEIAPETLALMDRCHESFEALVRERVAADPQALIYGVTSAPGDRAATALDAEQQARRPTALWTAMAYGEALPERVVRGIVLARLANMLDGHAAARGRVGAAVAAMLDEPALPRVPVQGNGGSGEILALGSLFRGLSERTELSAKERMALINGSPCAAALVADIALAARARTALAEQVFALAADVVGAPREAYSPELEELWGDEHETAALRSLRSLLAAGSPGELQRHQAAVSFRILPRVLGAARRAAAAAEAAAAGALRSVTDNPVYIPPSEGRRLGTVFSTGGYHNATATPAMDAVAAQWADLCQLAERHTDHLFQHPVTALLLSAEEWSIKPVHMAQNWWAEEARSLAAPTLLSLGGFGQNDIVGLPFLAWRKADAIGRCLDGALAALAGVCSQALHVAGRGAGPALDPLVAEVREWLAPVTEPREVSQELGALMAAFTARVYDA